MSPFIPEELDSIAEIASEYCILSSDRVMERIRGIRELIDHISIVDMHRYLYDFSQYRPEEIHNTLMSFDVDADEAVNVIWVSDRKGIRVNHYKLLVTHFEDMYYAGCDDIWLTNDIISWIIEINHEEVLWFYSVR